MTAARKRPSTLDDTGNRKLLELWVQVMPSYMKKLDDMHLALVGDLNVPGMQEKFRDLQQDTKEIKEELFALQQAYLADTSETQLLRAEGFARIERLEETSIILWVRNHKKMSLLLFTLLIILLVPELRAPLLVILQNEWVRMVTP